MKLAEALILRKDLQNRMQLLRERLTLNARVQEGEAPSEDPKALITELESISNQLEELITKINLRNANTEHNGESITAMLARREVLSQRISILNSLLNTASNTVMRGSRMEVKIYSTVDVAELRKANDKLSLELRKLDMEIQSVNWTVEL